MDKFEDLKFYDKKNLDGGLRKKGITKTSTNDKPLISIITTVLNNEKYLRECLDSIHQQEYSNFEHIVIDGASVDDTLNIIKNYDDKIDYWCSQKDKGIYDAFNLGMKLSSGEIICFVNSDDKFYSNKTLNYVCKEFKNKKISTLFLVQLKNIGLFCMVTNHGKFIIAGVFIQVIQLVFLLKETQQKKLVYII